MTTVSVPPRLGLYQDDTARAFLDAYLDHGSWADLTLFVGPAAAAEGAALRESCQAHPSGRRVTVVEAARLAAWVDPAPPATVIHFPDPPAARYAWARAHGGSGAVALSGGAPTLSTPAAVEALRALVTAPFEAYDALICPSTAAADVVRAVTGAYADYLRDRHGGAPRMRARLAVIPPGVDTTACRPATAAERARSRQALAIADDAVAVLYVGPLSLHAQAHPFPLYDGLARAARATGRAVHLVLAGRAALAAIARAFLDGARVFAPGVRVTLVDSAEEAADGAGAWAAADLVATFPDSLPAACDPALGAAMARGLPVVAADWGGARDQVAAGETGLLVPTALVRGATRDASARLVLGESNYDHFLAECNQTVVVDLEAAAAAFRRLIADDNLRRRMGAAGRARALQRFAWPVVIAAHERLWHEQEAARRDRAPAPRAEGRHPPALGPAGHPAPEHAHAGDPTALWGDDARVVADAHARERLAWLLDLALTHYMAHRRAADPAVLRAVLAAAAAPRTLADLDAVLAGAGVAWTPGRATLAWMLKYGLLRPAPAPAPPGADRGDDRLTP